MQLDIKKTKESFEYCVRKYKDAMRYSRDQSHMLFRAYYGVKTFGLPYILHRLNLSGIPGGICYKLFFGRKMLFPLKDRGSHAFGMYGIMADRSERKLTMWLITNLQKSDVFYDVGANLGFYTALAEEITVEGEIHAFEANDTLCPYLYRNFSHAKSVHISCSAIGASDGEHVSLYVPDKDDSSSGSQFNLAGSTAVTLSCQSLALDTYVDSGNLPPTILKLDIEGGEYDAILGAVRLIEKYKPRIILEVWGGEMGRKHSDKAVQKLHELGYTAYTFSGDGSMPSTEIVRDPVGSLPETPKNSRDNFLFMYTTEQL